MCRCLIVLVKKRGEGERETHMIFRVLFFIIVLLDLDSVLVAYRAACRFYRENKGRQRKIASCGLLDFFGCRGTSSHQADLSRFW
jgi:hypothetical protein